MNGRSSTKASNCGTTQRATCALEVTSHVTMTSRYMKHDNAIDRETRKTHDLNDGYTADMLKDGRKVARHSTECDVRGKAWFRHASLSVSQETRLRMAGAGRIHARIVRECRAHGPLLQNRNASSAGGRSRSHWDAPCTVLGVTVRWCQMQCNKGQRNESVIRCETRCE